MSITERSGHAMGWSSITGDNVPPHIQTGIDTSANFLGLTATIAQPITKMWVARHDTEVKF